MTVTNVLWASGWVIWAASVYRQMWLQPDPYWRVSELPAPWAAARSNHVSSTGAIHQSTRAPGTGPASCKELGPATRRHVAPASHSHESHDVTAAGPPDLSLSAAASGLLGGGWRGSPCFLGTD